MVCPVHERCKNHQKPRHQEKDGTKAQENGLDQNGTDVPAETVLHEGQCQKTGDGGEAAG